MRKKDLEEQDIEGTIAPGNKIQVPMDYIGTLIASLNDASYSALIDPIKQNDALIILGACGYESIARKITAPFGLRGGEWFKVKVLPESGGDGANPMGMFNPNTGSVGIATDVASALVEGSATYEQNDTVLHELLHRAFSVLHLIVNRNDSFTEGQVLKNMLPVDLLGKWRGGWGEINFRRYPIEPTSTGQLGFEGRPIQKNPEHAMLYSQLGSSGYQEGFIKDWVYTNARVAREFGWSGGEHYDGMDGDAMVRYWNDLYDQTEQAVSNWLIHHLGETSARLIADPEIQEYDQEFLQKLIEKRQRLLRLEEIARSAGLADKLRQIRRLIAVIEGQIANAERYGGLVGAPAPRSDGSHRSQ